MVIIGVNERGQKQFLAIEDGVRESPLKVGERFCSSSKAVAWMLLSCLLEMVPWDFGLAIDGIYPQARQQRCWVHKTANILNSLSKTSQPKAKQAIHEIMAGRDKDKCRESLCALNLNLSVQVSKDYPLSTERSWKITGLLWFSCQTSAEYTNQQSDWMNFWHHKAQNQKKKGLSQHDVQVWTMCKE